MPGLDPVLEALERDGCALISDAWGANDVAVARAEVRRILAHTPAGRNDFEGHRTRRVYALFDKTRAFDDVAVHALVLGVLDRLLGHYQLSAPAAIDIGPGETAQVLHTDDAIYPVPRPHAEMVVNVMWPLDEFTADNGATRVVLGSHRWGDERPGPATPTAAIEMHPGDALVCLGSLWHGGGSNRTDRSRLGVVLHYAAGWLRPAENHVLAVRRDVVRTLPTRLQELLGYNIQPPFLGYVDGRHPRRLLES